MADLLGREVRDKISGFEGIAYAAATYLNGCTRILIEPTKLKDDGTPIDGQWFDDQQVLLVGAGISTKKKRTGGPQVRPTRAPNPK